MMWYWEALQTRAPAQLMVQLILVEASWPTIIVHVIVVRMKRTNPVVEEAPALATATVTISINR